MANHKLTQAEISQLVANYESELRKLEFQRNAVIEAISKLQKPTASIEVSGEKIVEAPKPEPKKRGPKAGAKKAKEIAIQPIAEEKPAEGKKRGRKPAAKAEMPAKPIETATAPVAETTKKTSSKKAGKASESTTPVPAPKGKGRPKKVATEPAKTPAAKAPKPQKAKKVKAEASTEQMVKGKPGPKPTYNIWDHFIFDHIKKVGKPMTSADIIDAMKEERDKKDLQLGDTALSQQLNRTLTKLGGKLDLLNKEHYDGKGKIYSLKNPNATLPK